MSDAATKASDAKLMPVRAAREMAANGLGADDIWVRLREFGLTYQAARIIVFGKRKEAKAS